MRGDAISVSVEQKGEDFKITISDEGGIVRFWIVGLQDLVSMARQAINDVRATGKTVKFSAADWIKSELGEN